MRRLLAQQLGLGLAGSHVAEHLEIPLQRRATPIAARPLAKPVGEEEQLPGRRADARMQVEQTPQQGGAGAGRPDHHVAGMAGGADAGHRLQQARLGQRGAVVRQRILQPAQPSQGLGETEAGFGLCTRAARSGLQGGKLLGHLGQVDEVGEEGLRADPSTQRLQQRRRPAIQAQFRQHRRHQRGAIDPVPLHQPADGGRLSIETAPLVEFQQRLERGLVARIGLEAQPQAGLGGLQVPRQFQVPRRRRASGEIGGRL